MTEKDARLRYLLKAYIDNSITSIEMRELKARVSALKSDEDLNAIVDDLWNSLDDAPTATLDSELIYRRIVNDPRISTARAGARVKSGLGNKLRRWAASVAALLLATAALFFYLNRADAVSDKPHSKTHVAAMITPGSQKATLTLADGRIISLDEASTGDLVEQGGFRIVKTGDGKLNYEKLTEVTGAMAGYHTIQTPRGGEYQLVLPDGTNVWLNAASSLRYPVSFDDSMRIVELVGEAYFEVTRAEKRRHRIPFVVKTAQQEVQVLGTHFNIKAYPEEPTTKTTLLEGRVRVAVVGGVLSEVLQPNEEATTVLNDGNLSISMVDPANAIAWKNGIFAFHNNTVAEMMNTISRWYDVEVEYEGGGVPADRTFGGTISKFESFEKLLRTIELTGTVKFRVEGRRVIVMT